MDSNSANFRLESALTVGHRSVVRDGACGGLEKLTARILSVFHTERASFEVSGLVAVGIWSSTSEKVEGFESGGFAYMDCVKRDQEVLANVINGG